MDMRTCAAQVMVDFLMRRGFVSPDEDGYLELLAELRNAECRYCSVDRVRRSTRTV